MPDTPLVFDVNSWMGEMGISNQLLIDMYLNIEIFGPPNTGKTTFLLSAPNPLVADLEGSAEKYMIKAPIDRKTHKALPFFVNEAGSWKRFACSDPVKLLDVVRTLDTQNLFNNTDFLQTFCIDPFSKFWQWLQDGYSEEKHEKMLADAEKYHKAPPKEGLFITPEMGFKDWGPLKRPYVELMDTLQRAHCHKIYTSHSTIKMVDGLPNKNGYRKPEVVGNKSKCGMIAAYAVDISLEFIIDTDDANKANKPGVVRVHKDRTQTFMEGEIIHNANFELWRPYLNLAAKGLAHKSDGPGQTMQGNYGNKPSSVSAYDLIRNNARVIELQSILGIDDDMLKKISGKYKNNLNSVMSAMEAKLPKETPDDITPPASVLAAPATPDESGDGILNSKVPDSTSF
jgi:hypothetical protein